MTAPGWRDLPGPAHGLPDPARQGLTGPSWTALIRRASARLAEASVASPDADARALTEHVAGRALALADPPTAGDEEALATLLARRERREPLQHILATMHFRHLTLACRPGVFVVRPETELVAGHAIDAARAALAARGEASVADLCTGSGAIAIAVAIEAPGSRVSAVDISPAAISLARENSERYGGLVDFAVADAARAFEGREGSFDVVVSNPPYVPAGQTIEPEVAADPPAALWGGGDDGLDIPRAIVARARQLLAPGGVLVVEHDERQGPALRDFALSIGLSPARTLEDLAGRARMLWARLG